MMNSSKLLNSAVSAGIAFVLSASTMALANDTVSQTLSGFNYSEKSLDEKAVRIADPSGNNRGNTASVKPQIVKLDVSPSKPSYRVNERMNFMVKGEQDYYLYVFNLDPVTKKSVMLIPNANTKDHHLRANKRYNIPGTVDFYADRPGTEKLVFIGATKPLPLKQSDFKQLGEFSMADSKSIDDAVYTLDPKAVRIGSPSSDANRGGNQPKVVTLRIY